MSGRHALIDRAPCSMLSEYTNTFYGWYYTYRPGNYVNAATIEKKGTKKRTVKIENIPEGTISVMVRGYRTYETTDGEKRKAPGQYSVPCSVEVKASKIGYTDSYDFSSVKEKDCVTFGAYEQDYPINGKDPIEWIVYEKTDDSLFVISKDALDCLPYNTTVEDVTWETCTLRKWLNEVFYNIAFNEAEKSMILTTLVSNEDNYYYRDLNGTTAGNDTKDKIFVPSDREMTNTERGYWGVFRQWDINRRCTPSDYAVAQGTMVYLSKYEEYATKEGRNSCCWWLRSPGANNNVAAYVEGPGNINVVSPEEGGFTVDGPIIAVRPAMRIKIKSDDPKSAS